MSELQTANEVGRVAASRSAAHLCSKLDGIKIVNLHHNHLASTLEASIAAAGCVVGKGCCPEITECATNRGEERALRYRDGKKECDGVAFCRLRKKRGRQTVNAKSKRQAQRWCGVGAAPGAASSCPQPGVGGRGGGEKVGQSAGCKQ